MDQRGPPHYKPSCSGLGGAGVENSPECWGKLRAALEGVGWVEASVKELQVALGDATFT